MRSKMSIPMRSEAQWPLALRTGGARHREEQRDDERGERGVVERSKGSVGAVRPWRRNARSRRTGHETCALAAILCRVTS